MAAAGDAAAPVFKSGAIVTVRANSIWFEEAVGLSRWQESKRSMGTEAFAAYEASALGEREAWQFLQPLAVKILGYDAGKLQVHVELQTPGRLKGTTWYLDAAAIEP